MRQSNYDDTSGNPTQGAMEDASAQNEPGEDIITERTRSANLGSEDNDETGRVRTVHSPEFMIDA